MGDNVMRADATRKGFEQSRREFLATGTAALAATALPVAPGLAQAPARHPKRGGTIRFATRDDTLGLDTHRNAPYFVSHPLAGITGGLLDFNARMEVAPGIASAWDASQDMKTWTFRLRRGAEFHNGETVDAQAVKWNLERILDPKIGQSFIRSALADLERVVVEDKYTVTCQLKEPNAAFDSNLIYFPVNLLAPGAADKAATHPVGCGPFKFVSWKRFDHCELVRFENFWETDAEGNALPYLDGIVGRPKKEDRVRLTSLRAGEVDLIDNVAYADAPNFVREHGAAFATWEVPQAGTAYLVFNHKNGPFSDKDNPDGLMLRTAAAHAIDHRGINESVFNKQGAIARGFYSETSPWYVADIAPPPVYDPDKAKALRKKANGGDARLLIVANEAFPYMQQTGELVHAMLREAGFTVTFEVQPGPVLLDKLTKGEFDINSAASPYAIDPDGYFARLILSTSPNARQFRGYRNEKVDEIIRAAKVERDKAKRRQMYGDVESILNKDLPFLYTHFVPLLQAGSRTIKGYKPAFTGPFQYAGGGLRTAWLENNK
jgi:peptide/nickel transport system substrate-binding protein